MGIFKNLILALFSPLIGLAQAIQLRKFRLKKPATKTTGSETWLLQSVSNFAYFYRYFYYFQAIFNAGHSPQIICLNTTFFFKKNRSSLKKRLMDLMTQNAYTNKKWQWIYRSVLGSNQWIPLEPLQLKKSDDELAQSYFNNLKSKDDLEQLMLDGIWAGDLIYDTYLRFKPAATILDLRDPFLLELIQKSLSAIAAIKKIFDENKISRLVISYSSYIHHGLLLRIAIDRGILVHSLAGDHQLICTPDHSFPYHTRNFHFYRNWFETVPDKKTALEVGKQLINTRLSGQKDVTNAYMKQSSFADNGRNIMNDPRIDQRPKIVFMAHAFFDSPHSYGRMLFSDFYEWLDVSLSWATESSYQFLVKQHPNGTSDDEPVIRELTQKYPNVVFLDKSTPNGALAKLPISALVTVYGTVAHEFAALGHTMICAGVNPHSSYSFCYEPMTREDYKNALTGKKTVKTKINLDEIYEFMYVHNYRMLYDKEEFSIFNEFAECIRDFGSDATSKLDLINRELKTLNSL